MPYYSLLHIGVNFYYAMLQMFYIGNDFYYAIKQPMLARVPRRVHFPFVQYRSANIIS
jgi:hypothetical protein